MRWIVLLLVLFLATPTLLQAEENNAYMDHTEQLQEILGPYKQLRKEVDKFSTQIVELEKKLADIEDTSQVQEQRRIITGLDRQISEQQRALDMLRMDQGEHVLAIMQYLNKWIIMLLLLHVVIIWYLWTRKPDLVFTSTPGQWGAALRKTILPSDSRRPVMNRGKRGKAFALIILVALFFVLLLTVGAASAYSSPTAQKAGLSLWDLNRHSFDESMEDMTTLMDSSALERNIFMLANPVENPLPLSVFSGYKLGDGLSFSRKPSLVFFYPSIRIGSFEHVFLMGRTQYELGNTEAAFHSFQQAANLRNHPFMKPHEAQSLVLNMLCIAIMEGQDQAFSELQRTFIGSAHPRLRWQYIVFVLFEVSQEKGLELFSKHVGDDLKTGFHIAEAVSDEFGLEVALPYYELLVRRILDTQTTVLPEEMARVLVEAIYTLDKDENQKFLARQYTSLLKQLLPRIRNPRTQLNILETLITVDENAFVAAHLSNIAGLHQGRLDVQTFLQFVDIYQRIGETAIANRLLENAYESFYTQREDIISLIVYLIEGQNTSRAAKAMERMINLHKQLRYAPVDARLLQVVMDGLAFPNQGISYLGLNAMLNAMVHNIDLAREQLEDVLRQDAVSSLRTYAREVRINVNEMILLLEYCIRLEDWKRFEMVWPVFEKIMQQNEDVLKSDLQNTADRLQKNVISLESRIQEAPLNAQRADEIIRHKNEQLSELQRKIQVQKVLNSIASAAGYGVIILFLVWVLAVFFYCVARSAFFAQQAPAMKAGIFFFRFWEGLGFYMMTTLVLLPAGLLKVLLAQVMLSILGSNKNSGREGKEP